MNNHRRTLVSGLVLAAAFVLPLTVSAQSFSIGSDLMSRYVWRGTDFGESLSIQPTLEFSSGGLAIGTWASYSIAADGSGANEHDIYLSYTAGAFSFGVTDYYFPGPGGVGFFDFSDEGDGAHWIEPFISFAPSESFSLWASVFAYNDPDNSIYIEGSYAFEVDDVSLGLTAGLVPSESAFYGNSDFALVNVGLSASKEVPITDQFSLPVSVSYIINPDSERTFLVFGISL